ncbi:MAG: 16S rRNA (guanine(527)-N(7))-methyltransferase RsmG [Nitrospira sp.]
MEQDASKFVSSFRQFAAELAIHLDDSCLPLFLSYLSELKKWNRAINLTAIDDDQEILMKHFVDSIAGIKVIDNADKNEVLDVGTGAGFPGLPLKFMLPQMELELLEPSEKKGSFLRYVIGSLGLQHVTVVPAKLEQYVQRPNRRTFNYILVRAFKVDESGRLLADLLKPGGRVILYRAEQIPRGFKLDGLALVEEVEYELPAGYGHRVLSVFSK